MAGVTLYGPDNQPLPPSKPSRAAALAGGGRTAYDAAGYSSPHTEGWNPTLWSPDNERNPFRDIMVARARDLARNDGWASGAVTRILDNAIGASFRPISRPDHRALAAYSGNAAFDATWADEYGRAADARHRTWADDYSGKWCDASRQSWMSLMMGVAFRHLLQENDCCAALPWRPERVGPGRAHYATCVQLIDPDRLSNPGYAFDQRHLRGGIEIDDDQAAVAYNIRKAHPGDWWAGADSVTWERIPRETSWGRPVFVHYFEPDRANQHRGAGVGIFAPVVERLKMLIGYDVAELEGAIINAIFAAVAESPFDPELMAEALGDGDASKINGYQDARADYHDQRRLMMGRAKVLQMFPGEKLEIVKSERPNANFAQFEKAVLRNVAAATGAATPWITNDWSDANYSSMRAALNEAWKTVLRRRKNFGHGFAHPIRAAWLEECHDLGELPLPNGAPEFMECRTAYARAIWAGPGRGSVDPVAEAKAAVLRMDAGLSTLETEAMEYGGDFYEDILDQRAAEIAGYKKRGMAPPTWSGMNPMGEPASRTITDPEPA